MKCYIWSVALCGAENMGTSVCTSEIPGKRLMKCYIWSVALCGAENMGTSACTSEIPGKF